MGEFSSEFTSEFSSSFEKFEIVGFISSSVITFLLKLTFLEFSSSTVIFSSLSTVFIFEILTPASGTISYKVTVGPIVALMLFISIL